MHTHIHQLVLYLQESPFLPKATSAYPAKEPGAHVQISCSLFWFFPAAGGAFCLIYSVLLSRQNYLCPPELFHAPQPCGLRSLRKQLLTFSACVRATRRHQRPILQIQQEETLSSSQDFWLRSWKCQSPDFPKHLTSNSSFRVHSTTPQFASQSTYFCKADPLLCFAQGTHGAP